MKLRERKTVQWSLPVTIAAAIPLAGAITLLCLWCQPNALRTVVDVLRQQPLLIVLNALPIGLLLLFLTSVTGNLFYGAGLTAFISCALSVTNRIKIEVRDEPLFPRDFALVKEVGSALGDYRVVFPVAVIAVVVFSSLALGAIGLWIKCRPLQRKWLRGKPMRLLFALLSAAAFFLLTVTVYADTALYDAFPKSNPYYIPGVFNELGFPYCFCHQFTTFSIDKPDGFNRGEAEAWDLGGETGLGKDVHVVMIMNEAFSDLTDDPAFAYSDADDPLRNLHALREDAHAIAGKLVVPGFAGGTANTEFDVLTGMQTNTISSTTTSAMRTVNRNLDSVFRVFRADGYRTSFFHPGDDWFYNRENVYRWLGAETTRFADEMEGKEYKGRWVTDAYMVSQIEREFEDAVQNGERLFHYTTTIQNHMSYTADKYGASYAFPPARTNVPISEEVGTMLRVYIEGVRDADAMLGALHEYFAARSEPVVLVFWGDHLPYLGDNRLAYRELGMALATSDAPADTLASYEVPYLIWANDAAADALDWERAVQDLDLGAGNTLSASFLGATVLELTGRRGESPWFDFLMDLRRLAPVAQKPYLMLQDGTIVTEDGASALAPTLEKWRKWSYYKLRYKTVRN